jgi:hydroxyacylglutathione hydrolase
MIFMQYYLDCLSQASYLVADEATGQAVVVDPRRDVAEYLTDAQVVVRLARIGFDRVAGYLREPEGAFLDAPEHVRRASRLTAPELATALHGPRPPFVVDVRNPAEVRLGTIIPGAVPVPLAQLPGRLAEIPWDRPVVAFCAGGYRSSVAASLLRRAGLDDVSDLLGGYGAWLSLAQLVS